MTLVAAPLATAQEVDNRRLAICLMLAQAIFFAVETAAIHKIGPQMSFTLLAFFRAASGLALVAVLARGMGLQILRTRQLHLQLLRGGSTALYLWILVYSFGRMPFADAAALSYTQAAYIAGFSFLLLRERVTRLSWFGAAVGIAGALLIVKPAFAGWNSLYLLALLGTSLNGLSFVLTRYMQQEDSQLTTMFYTNLVPVVVNLPAMAISKLPTAETLSWLPVVCLTGSVGMYAGIVALRHAQASVLGPYTLLRLVISVVGAIIIFHEFPDALSALGTVLILIGCLLSVHQASSKLVTAPNRST